jgi:hypothetical protein
MGSMIKHQLLQAIDSLRMRAPIKSIRVRWVAGMPQDVIITATYSGMQSIKIDDCIRGCEAWQDYRIRISSDAISDAEIANSVIEIGYELGSIDLCVLHNRPWDRPDDEGHRSAMSVFFGGGCGLSVSLVSDRDLTAADGDDASDMIPLANEHGFFTAHFMPLKKTFSDWNSEISITKHIVSILRGKSAPRMDNLRRYTCGDRYMLEDGSREPQPKFYEWNAYRKDQTQKHLDSDPQIDGHEIQYEFFRWGKIKNVTHPNR